MHDTQRFAGPFEKSSPRETSLFCMRSVAFVSRLWADHTFVALAVSRQVFNRTVTLVPCLTQRERSEEC